MGNVEQRLQLLELRFQRLRRANQLLIAAIIGICCLAGAQVKAPRTTQPEKQVEAITSKVPAVDPEAPKIRDDPRTLEAEQFLLLDSDGRSRIKMEVTDDGPAITMWNEAGRKQVELACSSASSELRLLDSDESSAVSLEYSNGAGLGHLEIQGPQGESLTRADGFSVRDKENQIRLQLALLNGNVPLLGVSQRDQSGPPSIELTASDGSRSFKIHDERGHPLYSVFAADTGSTTVSMSHPDHERTIQWSTGPKETDGPTVAFFAPTSATGNGARLPFLELGLRRDRQPFIRIVDSAGRPRFAAPTD